MNAVEALRTLRESGPDPAAESAALGAWLLAEAGIEPGDGLVTVAPPGAGEVSFDGDGLSATLRRVPWARDADRIAVIVDGGICVVNRNEVSVEHRHNLAGDHRDTVIVSDAAAETAPGPPLDTLMLRGALTRAALMAGALERMSAMTTEYAGQRRQFGRPIASFQAVQAHLVSIAQHAALVGVAADAAIARQGAFEIAAAKLLANRAAIAASRAAHQVHGARGVTLEHDLPTETRRLWASRSEYGDEHHWAMRLGAAVEAAGADRLYPAITAGGAEVEV